MGAAEWLENYWGSVIEIDMTGGGWRRTLGDPWAEMGLLRATNYLDTLDKKNRKIPKSVQQGENSRRHQ